MLVRKGRRTCSIGPGSTIVENTQIPATAITVITDPLHWLTTTSQCQSAAKHICNAVLHRNKSATGFAEASPGAQNSQSEPCHKCVGIWQVLLCVGMKHDTILREVMNLLAAQRQHSAPFANVGAHALAGAIQGGVVDDQAGKQGQGHQHGEFHRCANRRNATPPAATESLCDEV